MKGSKKGQDNGPFVSMETASQGEGLKEEKASTSPPSGLEKWPLLWLGLSLSLPSLPGVHHGNPASKKRCKAAAASGVGGAREPRGNGMGLVIPCPDRTQALAWCESSPQYYLLYLGTPKVTSPSLHLPPLRLL